MNVVYIAAQMNNIECRHFRVTILTVCKLELRFLALLYVGTRCHHFVVSFHHSCYKIFPYAAGCLLIHVVLVFVVLVLVLVVCVCVWGGSIYVVASSRDWKSLLKSDPIGIG